MASSLLTGYSSPVSILGLGHCDDCSWMTHITFTMPVAIYKSIISLSTAECDIYQLFVKMLNNTCSIRDSLTSCHLTQMQTITTVDSHTLRCLDINTYKFNNYCNS